MSDPIGDLKRELLDAAERRGGHARSRTPRYGLLLAAALAVVAAAALLVTAPWEGSPGFLERAEAALTPPAGTVLHTKWELTSTSTDPACTVTRGPNEIWIDQRPPYRFRAVLNDIRPDLAADPRALACSAATPSELGGTLEPARTLMFVPPNTLSPSSVTFVSRPDPVTELREAISSGSAHDEGEAQLEGRTVRRIRIDPPGCPAPRCLPEPSYAYVDPETFYPVRLDSPHGAIAPGDGRPIVRVHLVMRTLLFEYLPRTPTTLALTDIEAQHPDATGSP